MFKPGQFIWMKGNKLAPVVMLAVLLANSKLPVEHMVRFLGILVSLM